MGSRERDTYLMELLQKASFREPIELMRDSMKERKSKVGWQMGGGVRWLDSLVSLATLAPKALKAFEALKALNPNLEPSAFPQPYSFYQPSSSS